MDIVIWLLIGTCIGMFLKNLGLHFDLRSKGNGGTRLEHWGHLYNIEED